MNVYLRRILSAAATWQALAGVFNAAAVSMTPPMAPVLQASINALIVAISAGFVAAHVRGAAITDEAAAAVDRAEARMNEVLRSAAKQPETLDAPLTRSATLRGGQR